MYNNYTATRQAKEKKQKIIGGIIALVGAIAIYVGFGTDIANITACNVTSKMYVTAEYSEYSCGYDMDGEYECETDSWSEPASEVLSVTTYNNKVSSSNVDNPILTTLGYYTSEMPPTDTSMSKEKHFDKFQNHSVRNMTVYLNRNGESDYFSKTASYNPQCNLDREKEKVITVKTWYGISYNTSA
jgi:hypothetical protein